MTLPTVIEIDVEQISPNPWQPRQTMDPEGLEQLAHSIRRDGLLQPIVVRPHRADLYELIAGQRRLTAWKMLLEEFDDWSGRIPAVVRHVDDKQVMIDALTENQERENVDPIEEARAIARALDEIPDITIAELARTLNIAPATMNDRLRILRLPAEVLAEISSGRMSWTAGRELLALTAPDHIHEQEIEKLLEQMSYKESLTGPDVRQKVRDVTNYPRTWRPLCETKFRYGAIATAPMFDVEEFKAANPNHLHRLPQDRGGTSTELWTCAAAAWSKAHRQAQDDMGIEPEADHARVNWARKVAGDNIVRRLKITEQQLLDDDLSDEEREALGTRGVFYRAASDKTKAIEQSWRGSVPEYFDQNECFNTCTSGAVYRPDYTGDEPLLKCQDSNCYGRKIREGIQSFKDKERKREHHKNAWRRKLEEKIQPVFEGRPGLARGMLVVALQRVRGDKVMPLGYGRQYEELNYYDGATRRLAAALGMSADEVVDRMEDDVPLWPVEIDELIADLENPVPAASIALSIALQRQGFKGDDLEPVKSAR